MGLLCVQIFAVLYVFLPWVLIGFGGGVDWVWWWVVVLGLGWLWVG